MVWNDFSRFNSIHVNDSSTALAPIELFRILIDEELLPWEEAFRIVFDSTTFTQHSLHMAKDKWPCELLERVLPRHLELIFKINFFMLQDFKDRVDFHTLSKLSLVEEYPIKQIRFSNLSFVMSHLVNGLSEMHVLQMKLELYKELN